MGWIRTVTVVAVVWMLGGCSFAPPSKDKVLPSNGPTTKEILKGGMGGGAGAAGGAPHIDRASGNGDANLAGYTRTAANELEVHFRRIPNPSLVMFVKPHLAGEVGIPGYSVRFPLYEHEHYALPGEVTPQ